MMLIRTRHRRGTAVVWNGTRSAAAELVAELAAPVTVTQDGQSLTGAVAIAGEWRALALNDIVVEGDDGAVEVFTREEFDRAFETVQAVPELREPVA